MRISWTWLTQVVLAIDQLANAVLSGNADETLSARCWRLGALATRPKWRWRVMRRLVDWLFRPWEINHCESAWQAEVSRAHMRGAYPVRE